MEKNSIKNRPLKILLLVHGLVTFAAAIVLIVAPAAIPQTVNIAMAPNEYLLSYFLGAAELGIAFLSVAACNIRDDHALRLIAATFIIFHIATAALELWALSNGLSSGIIFNIVLRILISVLFGYFGIYRLKQYK